MESHVGIICGKTPSPPLHGFADILAACLPSLRPLLNLLLFGSIDRNHRRDPSDRKRPGGPSARSYDIWGAHLKNHQIGQGNKAREMTDRESGCGYTQLSYEEHKEGTSISATNLELDDMHADQGIQVRTDVYIDGYGKK